MINNIKKIFYQPKVQNECLWNALHFGSQAIYGAEGEQTSSVIGQYNYFLKIHQLYERIFCFPFACERLESPCKVSVKIIWVIHHKEFSKGLKWKHYILDEVLKHQIYFIHCLFLAINYSFSLNFKMMIHTQLKKSPNIDRNKCFVHSHIKQSNMRFDSRSRYTLILVKKCFFSISICPKTL